MVMYKEVGCSRSLTLVCRGHAADILICFRERTADMHGEGSDLRIISTPHCLTFETCLDYKTLFRLCGKMTTIPPSRPSNELFHIAWVCVLPIEYEAARSMLHQEFDGPPAEPSDPNVYTYGRIQRHNLVIACPFSGQVGPLNAARFVATLKSKFPSIQAVFLIGIGGGVPDLEHDIRLGDVVISLSSESHGRIVQYDVGKPMTRSEQPRGPIHALLPWFYDLIEPWKLSYSDRQYATGLAPYLSKVFENPQRLPGSMGTHERPPDLLFRNDYVHQGGASCDPGCDPKNLIQRSVREYDEPKLHFGNIASGNNVIKDGVMRDTVSNALGGVLCFDMEATGIMSSLPCLVVRGISDYTDSHRNGTWQR
jgi:nucleoside phosphorylase